MPYLGKTPSQATRQRYYLTASGGETSISGTMTTGGTLTFNDGEFVDVKLNGVSLVAGTDYNTTTANTIGGLSALAANDQVEIVVYDTFSVFGGNVDGDFTVSNGTLTAGTVDINGGAVDGTTIGAASASTGAFTTISASGNVDFNGDLDVDGTTNLDVVDIDGAVDMASTLQVDGAITSSAGATITTADNNAQLTLTSTDTDANSGPRLDFIRNPSQAGADNDFLSAILHRGYNDAGTPELITYAEANVQIIDASDGSEDARFYINTMVAGSGRSRLNILPSETVFNDDSVDVDFRVESNANANMFFLDANGEHISFGTTNGTVAQSNITGGLSYKPAAQLEVSGNATQAAFFNRTDTGNLIGFMTGSSSVGAISVTGSGTTYHTTSDRRLKENIEPLVATDKLMAMNPVSYTWKAFPDEPRSMGFIAQEMAEVMPEAVSTNEHNDMMSMDYGRITPILVSALQDAHRKIEQLEQRIANMESK
jgi:hypothetical protein